MSHSGVLTRPLDPLCSVRARAERRDHQTQPRYFGMQKPSSDGVVDAVLHRPTGTDKTKFSNFTAPSLFHLVCCPLRPRHWVLLFPTLCAPSVAALCITKATRKVPFSSDVLYPIRQRVGERESHALSVVPYSAPLLSFLMLDHSSSIPVSTQSSWYCWPYDAKRTQTGWVRRVWTLGL